MKEIFERMRQLALPYLRQEIKKDAVLHTKGVINAMELLLEKEKGDEDILIPTAILHDVGWAKVPVELQKSNNEADKLEASRLHLKHAPSIINKILTEVGYNRSQIEKVIDIVVAHKFQNPKELEKQLLIDADAMSDAFKEQFYSDIESYNTTPQEHYEFRKRNEFYTKTARELFDREMETRRREIQMS